MILCQKPPSNYIKVDANVGFRLQKIGLYPMYKWEGYYYYHPNLKDDIEIGGE